MFSFPFIGIIFALIMVISTISRGRYKLPDKIALVFVLLLALPLINEIFMHRLIFISYGKYLSIQSYFLLYGFLLYIYVKSVIDTKFKLKKLYLLHLIPFVFFTIWQVHYPIPKTLPPPQRIVQIDSVEGTITEKSVPSAGSQEFHQKAYGPEAGIPPQDEPICKTGALLFYIFLMVSFAAYSIVSLIYINRKKPENSDCSSVNIKTRNKKRMEWMVISFLWSYLFAFITSMVKPEIFIDPLSGNNDSFDIALTFFLVSIVIFNIMQSTDRIKNEPEVNHDNIFTKKYERSGLKEEEARYYLKLLENFMKNEKPYLDSDLTISDLSERLNIPRHYLTQIINEKLNKNFFMYINEYRINEIKKMMSDSHFHNYTILRLAYQSGFNSKSRFNKAFKKFTGHTPSEYKKYISHSGKNSRTA